MKGKLIVMTSGLMALAVTTMALPAMMKEFNSCYKPDKNSKLKKAECAICHVDKKKTKLNPYGQALKKAMEDAKSKTLTADIIKKVEDLDSDKDGVKNIDEIKAGTMPGDSKSKPAKK